jgi:hypothetical protein
MYVILCFNWTIFFCLHILLSVNDKKLCQCCTSDLCYTDKLIILSVFLQLWTKINNIII